MFIDVFLGLERGQGVDQPHATKLRLYRNNKGLWDTGNGKITVADAIYTMTARWVSEVVE